MRYSIGFRQSILRRVLPPENQNVYTVAKEIGISPNTIRDWLKQYNEGTIGLESEGLEPVPSQRGAKEKLKLLLESRVLREEEKVDWLRRHGMHTEHLTLWEQELEGIITDKQEKLQKEMKELRKENQRLKKEAERNHKAMAEALALLTLKKKAEALFAPDEEE